MSAYIVNDITIHRILSFLEHRNFKSDISSSYIKRIVKKYILKNGELDLNRLGDEMLDLNIKAVNYRYKENTINKREYEFKNIAIDIFQALKSLRCWLYQCSEGNYDKTKLYKSFNDIKEILLSEIVENIPEYEKAEWG